MSAAIILPALSLLATSASNYPPLANLSKAAPFLQAMASLPVNPPTAGSVNQSLGMPQPPTSTTAQSQPPNVCEAGQIVSLRQRRYLRTYIELQVAAKAFRGWAHLSLLQQDMRCCQQIQTAVPVFPLCGMLHLTKV